MPAQSGLGLGQGACLCCCCCANVLQVAGLTSQLRAGYRVRPCMSSTGQDCRLLLAWMTRAAAKSACLACRSIAYKLTAFSNSPELSHAFELQVRAEQPL